MRDTAGSKMKQYVSITRKHGWLRVPSSLRHSEIWIDRHGTRAASWLDIKSLLSRVQPR